MIDQLGIRVVLPDRSGIKSGNGTQVYTADGHEIRGIQGMEISIWPNDIITAVVHIPIVELRGADDVLARFVCSHCSQELTGHEQQ